MVKVYEKKKKKGLKDINKVPENIRDLVQKELDNN